MSQRSFDTLRMRIMGALAVLLAGVVVVAVLGVAALRSGAVDVSGRHVAVVATGRNVALDTVREVLAGGQ